MIYIKVTDGILTRIMNHLKARSVWNRNDFMVESDYKIVFKCRSNTDLRLQYVSGPVLEICRYIVFYSISLIKIYF